MVLLFYLSNVCSCFLFSKGPEYALHNMAEKCFDHQMSQGKNLLHTNSIFTESAMHNEYKIFNCLLGIII